jgi:hypothetical protein
VGEAVEQQQQQKEEEGNEEKKEEQDEEKLYVWQTRHRFVFSILPLSSSSILD